MPSLTQTYYVVKELASEELCSTRMARTVPGLLSLGRAKTICKNMNKLRSIWNPVTRTYEAVTGPDRYGVFPATIVLGPMVTFNDQVR